MKRLADIDRGPSLTNERDANDPARLGTAHETFPKLIRSVHAFDILWMSILGLVICSPVAAASPALSTKPGGPSNPRDGNGGHGVRDCGGPLYAPGGRGPPGPHPPPDRRPLPAPGAHHHRAPQDRRAQAQGAGPARDARLPRVPRRRRGKEGVSVARRAAARGRRGVPLRRRDPQGEQRQDGGRHRRGVDADQAGHQEGKPPILPVRTPKP
jgi:hypothetical protein